jgi:hypothetical protein
MKSRLLAGLEDKARENVFLSTKEDGTIGTPITEEYSHTDGQNNDQIHSNTHKKVVKEVAETVSATLPHFVVEENDCFIH